MVKIAGTMDGINKEKTWKRKERWIGVEKTDNEKNERMGGGLKNEEVR